MVAEQVSLNFHDKYGFQKNYQPLEEKVSYVNSKNQDRSMRLGEVAITTATYAILEDKRSFSQDVYK